MKRKNERAREREREKKRAKINNIPKCVVCEVKMT